MLTSRNFVNLMLNEEVDERDQSAKEKTGKNFAVLNCLWIGWAKRKTPESPGQCCDEIADHKDIVPVMIICGSDIGPPSASKCSEYTHTGYDGWQVGVRSSRQEVPQGAQCEPRSRRDCNEHHEDGSLGVSIANGRRHGREPFLRVSIVFVLHNLVIVKPASHH